MSEAERKQVRPEDLERRALTLRAIGWQLLVFDAIIVVFVFVGMRTGSLLWLDWTFIEGMAGLGIIVIGSYWQAVALRQFGERARAGVVTESQR